VAEQLLPVFVYGSLLEGLHNHPRLNGAAAAGRGRTAEERFQMIDLGAFPAVSRGGIDPVVGELYWVDEKTLAGLDRLEGHPHAYRREPLRVVLDDGTELLAWTYLYPVARSQGKPHVAGGDWRAHRGAGRRVVRRG
jgi:gamma-glutamylcyclotransferase (GGCT)/AIG2-like uncharacterized protein YtfP